MALINHNQFYYHVIMVGWLSLTEKSWHWNKAFIIILYKSAALHLSYFLAKTYGVGTQAKEPFENKKQM